MYRSPSGRHVKDVHILSSSLPSDSTIHLGELRLRKQHHESRSNPIFEYLHQQHSLLDRPSFTTEPRCRAPIGRRADEQSTQIELESGWIGRIGSSFALTSRRAVTFL